MDSLGSLNQPVTFFTKNTGNSINTVIQDDNRSFVSNVFSPELNEQLMKKNASRPKKNRKSRRLNTIDSDYLPDSREELNVKNTETKENIFLSEEKNKFSKKIKQTIKYFLENTPLINYFFLKKKKYKIQETVSALNDITQDVDEMLNTIVPYGEEKIVYGNIAKNLTTAANIIVKANKDLEI